MLGSRCGQFKAELCGQFRAENTPGYTQSKGAIKLHFGLNDDGYLPEFMVATTGKVHEINVAKSLDYQPRSMICMDCGYTDYDWWEDLT